MIEKLDTEIVRVIAAITVPAVAAVTGASLFVATAGRGPLPSIPAFLGMVVVMVMILMVGGAIIPRIGGDPE